MSKYVDVSRELLMWLGIFFSFSTVSSFLVVIFVEPGPAAGEWRRSHFWIVRLAAYFIGAGGLACTITIVKLLWRGGPR